MFTGRIAALGNIAGQLTMQYFIFHRLKSGSDIRRLLFYWCPIGRVCLNYAPLATF